MGENPIETIINDTVQTQEFIEWVEENNQKAEDIIKNTTTKYYYKMICSSILLFTDFQNILNRVLTVSFQHLRLRVQLCLFCILYIDNQLCDIFCHVL